MHNWLWSVARFESSKIGAISYWLGATSLCRVFTGMPSLNISASDSAMHASTRSGMVPKYWSSSSWPFGGLAPNSVRPQFNRSGRAYRKFLSMRKYSCSGPTVVYTRCASVLPNTLRTRIACLLSASMLRKSGVFLSSASPVHDTNTVGMTSVAPLGDSRMYAGESGIPAGVAAGLEGGADAAGGEAAGVRLALDQFLAAELGDPAAGAGRAEEAVVLLGGQAGERLEQVGEVGGPVLERPVLHGAGDGVGDGRVGELGAEPDRLLERLEHRLGQPRLLHLLAEHQRAEQLLQVRGAEVDLVEVVLRGGDGLDRGLAGRGHRERLLGGGTNKRVTVSREPEASAALPAVGLVGERILRL